MALKKLVKGVVTAARPEVILKKARAGSALSHLLYLGIISTREGATSIKKISAGKTRRQMKKIDFDRAKESSFLLSCNRECHFDHLVHKKA